MCRKHELGKKLFVVLLFGCLLGFPIGLKWAQFKEESESVTLGYQGDLAGAKFALNALEKCALGHVEDAEKVLLTQLLMKLSFLSNDYKYANISDHDRAEGEQLALACLDYLDRNERRLDMRMPVNKAGIAGLKRMLKRESDKNRLEQVILESVVHEGHNGNAKLGGRAHETNAGKLHVHGLRL